jgi:N-acetylmuramoyl-L-alanine amidase
MAKLICLQSGHEGVTTGATGAPGEQELNVRIRNRLSQILISKGFVLQLVNANPSASSIAKDFDLFLALHGDANIYGTGGGVVSYIADYMDSSAASNAESKRIKEAIESMYFANSGIVNHPERNNRNMTEYYMWSQLSAKTPCVIMEMGVVQDAHDKVILADTDRVANAIARGVCKAFNVPFDTVPSQPTPPQIDYKKLYEESQKSLTAITAQLKTCEGQVNSLKQKLNEIKVLATV